MTQPSYTKWKVTIVFEDGIYNREVWSDSEQGAYKSCLIDARMFKASGSFFGKELSHEIRGAED